MSEHLVAQHLIDTDTWTAGADGRRTVAVYGVPASEWAATAEIAYDRLKALSASDISPLEHWTLGLFATYGTLPTGERVRVVMWNTDDDQ